MMSALILAALLEAGPAVCRPVDFTTFMEDGRTDLTEDRLKIVESFALLVSESPGARVVRVVGHYDTLRSADESQRLSEQAANYVSRQLERFGVDRSRLTIEATGETQLLEPTDDGVSELINRRVVMTIEC